MIVTVLTLPRPDCTLAFLAQQILAVQDGSAGDGDDLLGALGFSADAAPTGRVLVVAGPSGQRRWRVPASLGREELPLDTLRRPPPLFARLHFPRWLGGFALPAGQPPLFLVDLQSNALTP